GLLDLVYAEVVLRQKHGERPQLEEYLARFPDHAEALRRQFLLDDALGDSALCLSMDQRETVSQQTSSFAGGAPEDPMPRVDPLLSPGGHVREVTIVVPGYEILGELGRGGMGIVYQARQLRPRRLVALKMIRTGVAASAEDLRRFREEADTVAAFQH